MSGGGKGGSQTTSVTIPPWLEQAAQTNLARADQLASIGYTPYYGPDVAAMTPMQMAAMQGTNQAASAFGLGGVDPMTGMPQPQQFAGGVQGYSSAPLFNQSLAQLQAARPGQFAALQAPFIDPIAGAPPQYPFGSTAPLVAPPPVAQTGPIRYERGGGDYGEAGNGSRGDVSFGDAFGGVFGGIGDAIGGFFGGKQD